MPGHDADNQQRKEQLFLESAGSSCWAHQPEGCDRLCLAIRYRSVLRVILSKRLASDTLPPVLCSASESIVFSTSSTESPSERSEGLSVDASGWRESGVFSDGGRCSGQFPLVCT